MAKAKSKAPAKAPAKAAAKAKPGKAGGVFDEYWNDPDNHALLRVWADSLVEQGDPRGEFIQTCLVENPTQAHHDARTALQKKHGGKLVGPAREYLREWSFGANGLVDAARCEADKLAAGVDEIGRLNPRLILTVTSLKKKQVVDEFAKISLDRIYCVDFSMITGTHGGTNISDKNLIAIAPAFRNVRHLVLSCMGYADECFTPVGLRALGEAMTQLEVLTLQWHRSGDGPYDDRNRPRIPPADEYARVIAESRGFAKLRALWFAEIEASALGKMKVKLNVGDAPKTATQFEAAKA